MFLFNSFIAPLPTHAGCFCCFGIDGHLEVGCDPVICCLLAGCIGEACCGNGDADFSSIMDGLLLGLLFFSLQISNFSLVGFLPGFGLGGNTHVLDVLTVVNGIELPIFVSTYSKTNQSLSCLHTM